MICSIFLLQHDTKPCSGLDGSLWWCETARPAAILVRNGGGKASLLASALWFMQHCSLKWASFPIHCVLLRWMCLASLCKLACFIHGFPFSFFFFFNFFTAPFYPHNNNFKLFWQFESIWIFTYFFVRELSYSDQINNRCDIKNKLNLELTLQCLL